MNNKKIAIAFLVSMLFCILTACSLGDEIKGTWYLIDDSDATLEIYDETAVFHNHGRWDDYYIEWTLDDINLVFNVEGEALYFQVLDDPEYGQVLYDTDEGEIFACHKLEDADALINKIMEEQERERLADVAAFQEIYEEAEGLLIGTWQWGQESLAGYHSYTYVFNKDGTYTCTEKEGENTESVTSEYELVTIKDGEEYIYDGGYPAPEDVAMAIKLPESDLQFGGKYWFIDLEDLREGNLETIVSKTLFLPTVMYEKID